MNLLQDKLVQKYFGCKSECYVPGFMDYHLSELESWHLSVKLLDAMQQPIQKGDRYLCLQIGSDDVYDLVSNFDCVVYHPHYLRLPDAFQKQDRQAEEYVVPIEVGGTFYDVCIDLECFAKAISPYLERIEKESK